VRAISVDGSLFFYKPVLNLIQYTINKNGELIVIEDDLDDQEIFASDQKGK